MISYPIIWHKIYYRLTVTTRFAFATLEILLARDATLQLEQAVLAGRTRIGHLLRVATAFRHYQA